jgi:hypothetical protein
MVHHDARRVQPHLYLRVRAGSHAFKTGACEFKQRRSGQWRPGNKCQQTGGAACAFKRGARMN